jgi:hypothetical protein
MTSRLIVLGVAVVIIVALGALIMMAPMLMSGLPRHGLP